MRYNTGFQNGIESELAEYLRRWCFGPYDFFREGMDPLEIAQYLICRTFSAFRCLYSAFRPVEKLEDPTYQGTCGAIMKYLLHRDRFADESIRVRACREIFSLITAIYCPTLFTSDLTGYRNGVTGYHDLFIVTGQGRSDLSQCAQTHFRAFSDVQAIIGIDGSYYLVEEVPYPPLHADPRSWNAGVHIICTFHLEDGSGPYKWTCRYRFIGSQKDTHEYGLAAAPSIRTSLIDALLTLEDLRYQLFLQEVSSAERGN